MLPLRRATAGPPLGRRTPRSARVPQRYEKETDEAVGARTYTLEPVMKVAIGGIVGFTLIAMYMPIFDIAGKLMAAKAG